MRKSCQQICAKQQAVKLNPGYYGKWAAPATGKPLSNDINVPT
ncbi:hypothetical protein ACYEXS_34085 [Paenibacillus sp. MAH-36]